jgi:plastocyanin domain-containing protein
MAEKIIVTAVGLLLIAGVNWYFLLPGRKKKRRR